MLINEECGIPEQYWCEGLPVVHVGQTVIASCYVLIGSLSSERRSVISSK